MISHYHAALREHTTKQLNQVVTLQYKFNPISHYYAALRKHTTRQLNHAAIQYRTHQNYLNSHSREVCIQIWKANKVIAEEGWKNFTVVQTGTFNLPSHRPWLLPGRRWSQCSSICPHCLRQYRTRRINQAILQIDRLPLLGRLIICWPYIIQNTSITQFEIPYLHLRIVEGFTRFKFAIPGLCYRTDVFGNSVLLRDKSQSGWMSAVPHQSEWNFSNTAEADHPNDMLFLSDERFPDDESTSSNESRGSDIDLNLPSSWSLNWEGNTMRDRRAEKNQQVQVAGETRNITDQQIKVAAMAQSLADPKHHLSLKTTKLYWQYGRWGTIRELL